MDDPYYNDPPHTVWAEEVLKKKESEKNAFTELRHRHNDLLRMFNDISKRYVELLEYKLSREAQEKLIK